MDQQIKDLKDIINLIEVDTDLNLKGEHLSDAQDIINGMIFRNNRKQKGYFISINDIGPDDNFTRFYTVLGKMNRADAIRINEENSDDSEYGAGYDDGVREVTEETYKLWRALACYSEMLEFSKWMDMSMRLSDIELDPIKKKVSELRKQLGLHRKWQVVRLYRK
jgi:hypothetical protein